MAKKPKSYTPPQKPRIPSLTPQVMPDTIPETPLSASPELTPKPGMGMSSEEMERLLESPVLAETPVETPIQTKKPTTKTIESPAPCTDPPIVAMESEPVVSKSGPHESQFLRMQDQIMRRWPKGNIMAVLGALARTGCLSQLPDWDIPNTGEVSDILLSRLQTDAYLRSLWSVICVMKNSERGNHLGNPRNEATMATGLAIMDYLNEICPRPTYAESIQDANIE